MKIILIGLFVLSILYICTSCTFSINMVHTEGTASDVVDENQKADADIEPQFNIPASAF